MLCYLHLSTLLQTKRFVYYILYTLWRCISGKFCPAWTALLLNFAELFYCSVVHEFNKIKIHKLHEYWLPVTAPD